MGAGPTLAGSAAARTTPTRSRTWWRRSGGATWPRITPTAPTRARAQEIAELLDQKLNVHEIERYFPDIESDPEAALYLAKAVA